METQSYFYDQVTLLITHYNRSLSLERLLNAFLKLAIRFREIIVSDDGSQKMHVNHLEQLKDTFGFRLICSERNKGLANNINKGQREVKTPYTLYIQEDFIPSETFCVHLQNGLKLLELDPKIDLVRFYAYHQYPYLKPVGCGFSEMEFGFWRPGYWQLWCYSDHPHLRRSSFPEKFGLYEEGIASDRAEYKMAVRFLQRKGKAVIHEDFRNIFSQKNTSDEPSRVARKRIRKFFQLTDSVFIKIIRAAYRNVKFRFEYIFS